MIETGKRDSSVSESMHAAGGFEQFRVGTKK